jgi:hypothetical protein
MSDHFNPDTYMVIDRITGEEIDITVFVEDARKSGWEKAYAGMLASYINCCGAQSANFLAWMLRNRDGKNMIQGTQREISSESNVSLSVVSKVMKTLTDQGLIRQVRSGCYMVSPKMIRNGETKRGVMLLKLWEVAE